MTFKHFRFHTLHCKQISGLILECDGCGRGRGGLNGHNDDAAMDLRPFSGVILVLKVMSKLANGAQVLHTSTVPFNTFYTVYKLNVNHFTSSLHFSRHAFS